MTDDTDNTPQDAPRPKPARVTGVKHIIAALTYSVAGVRLLWGETAFRLELFFAVSFLAAYMVLGAPADQIMMSVLLMLVLFAIEALNTAIEYIVDYLSPHWSEFARDTKDLGSFAVFCLLSGNGFYFLFVVYPLIF